MQGSSSAPQLIGGERERDEVTNINGNGIANGYLNDSTDSEDDEEGFTHGGSDGSSPSPVIPKLKVFDLRSYAAALGNRAKGGGCECTGELGDRLFECICVFLRFENMLPVIILYP